MILQKLFNNKKASVEQVTCPYCKEYKHINEYKEYKCPDGKRSNYEVLRDEENTFCEWSGCFTCSECYVRNGMTSEERLKYDAYLVFRLKVEPLPHQDTNKIAEYLY